MEKQLTCTELALVADAMRTIRQIGQGAGWLTASVSFLTSAASGGGNVHVSTETLKAVSDVTGQDIQFAAFQYGSSPWTGSVEVEGVKFFALVRVDQLAVLGYTSPLIGTPLPSRLPVSVPDPVAI